MDFIFSAKEILKVTISSDFVKLYNFYHLTFAKYLLLKKKFLNFFYSEIY